METTLPSLESPWGRLALRVLFEDWITLKNRLRRQRLTGPEALKLERVEEALRELGIDAATLRRLSDRQTSGSPAPASASDDTAPAAPGSSVAHPVV